MSGRCRGLKCMRLKRAFVLGEAKGFETQQVHGELGEHKLSIRVKAPASSFDQTEMMAADFVAAQESSLLMVGNRHGLKVMPR
jgi:hypothetical protein